MTACVRTAVGAVLLSSCGINTSALAGTGPVRDDAALEAAAARALFAQPPLTNARVLDAFHRMAAAARGTSESDTLRIGRLVDTTLYAIWLARHLEGKESRAFADSALVFANSTVAADTSRVEGFFYRAIAAGLIAGQDRFRGRSAMSRIQADGRRAVELDAAFDAGGPHRVLGALYLRAPGPPMGVGSLRRAVDNLEQAVRLGPERVDNLLYLAEAYLEDRLPDRAAALVDRAEVLHHGATEPETPGTEAWIVQLRSRLGRWPASH